MPNIPDSVAEFQGLYGPFTVAERVLQKIWLHQDFALGQIRLTDGRSLEIVTPGDWNLLGGPDFHGAQLRIDGRELRGDVEVHFHASDWRAHGHPANPTFQGVALHVVLFPPDESGRPACRGDGVEIPTLVLLPLLHRDLEEYAADDALETITARDEWRRFAELGRRTAGEIEALLKAKAEARWRQKVHYEQLRIGKLGWVEAAHQTALEILGYRRNRAAMLTIAARYPLHCWGNGVEVDRLFEEGRAYWQLQGLRPANHPRTRLRQYAAWMRAIPDWPQRLVDEVAQDATPTDKTSSGTSVGATRRNWALGAWRSRWAQTITGGAVSGTRLDTLVCDGFLPLVAARTGRELLEPWFHWFLGDVPLAVRQAMPRLGLARSRAQPFCHGYGQGLLGWILEQKEDASP